MTFAELIQIILAQGATVRDCEGCTLEEACTTVRFWCHPLVRLLQELKVEVPR